MAGERFGGQSGYVATSQPTDYIICFLEVLLCLHQNVKQLVAWFDSVGKAKISIIIISSPVPECGKTMTFSGVKMGH